tara:strand:+ start:3270 stop:4748 length:1479 start_codon:yes stop_codon:yes gene_type:complete
MNIFEHFFNKELEKYKEFNLFNTYFQSNFSTQKDSYDWRKYIEYKFFILKNYLFQNTINSSTDILPIFNSVQRKLLALYKFKQICLLKTNKSLNEQIDLNFNPISSMNSKYYITLIHNKHKSQFSMFDLIRIINSSLSYEVNFFPEPKKIKNPWDNEPFSISNLYNIYFFIKKSNLTMPTLFSRFFESNFDIKHFENYNQFIIKDYIINNCHLLTDSRKMSYIRSMIATYNRKNIKINNTFNIDKKFPSKRLVEVMGKFIKPFLLANYSYESDIRIKYRMKLNKLLREFKKQNPLFGRKIISLSIRKIYYISRLIYEEKQCIFLPFNSYIPKPEFISIEDKGYFIDFKESNIYTTFPVFESSNKSIIENKNILLSSNTIKEINFTNEQMIIIKEKYYHVINDLLNSATTTPTSTVNNDTDTDTDIGEEFNEFIVNSSGDHHIVNNPFASIEQYENSFDSETSEDELNDTRFIFNIEADISNNSDTDDDINDL